MGSVKLLKMQHHKELKRGRGSGGAPGSSPAPAGEARHQQVGGGGPTRTVSGCGVLGALFAQVLGSFCPGLGAASPGDGSCAGMACGIPATAWPRALSERPHPCRGSYPHSSLCQRLNLSLLAPSQPPAVPSGESWWHGSTVAVLATGTHRGIPGASPGHPLKTKSFPLCLVLPCLEPCAPGGKHPPNPHWVKSWCFGHFQLHPWAPAKGKGRANQPSASGSCTWQDSSTVPALPSVPSGPVLSLSPPPAVPRG